MEGTCGANEVILRWLSVWLHACAHGLLQKIYATIGGTLVRHLGLLIQARPAQTKVYASCAARDLCDTELRCHVKKIAIY